MGKRPPGAKPIKLGPATDAGRIWPVDQYADLPPTERAFILDNLALAGVRIGPPQPPPGPAGTSSAHRLGPCRLCEAVHHRPAGS